MNEQQKCSGKISRDWHSYQCSNTGKLEHEGKFYCGLHHPPTDMAKRKARDAAWTEKFDAEHKARKLAEAERLEKERRAALFPDLLEALKPFAMFACSPPGECDCHNCRARAAIARALPEGAPNV